MIDLVSKRDIEKISLELLKGSKAWGKFPTNVDGIVNYSELVVNKTTDIAKVHDSYLHKAPNALFKALEKIRGLFDRKKKLIYLDLSQLPTRKNFVKLHETGHGVLPWQQRVHDVLEDDDDSLGSFVTEEFEMEANYFACVTLFQHEQFLTELKKLNLGIDAAMYLGKQFGASVHATLRNYVEKSPKRCALLVLEKRGVGLSAGIFRKSYVLSAGFLGTFGKIDFPETFDLSWPFAQNYFSGRRGILADVVDFGTSGGEVQFAYQFFNNSYNGFVFMYPKGEKQSAKTQIIITATNHG